MGTRGLLLALAALSLLWSPAADAESQKRIGWVEKAKLYPEALLLHAKVDTGAEHSSLHARRVREFDRDGELWVRFRIRNRDGESVTLERPVLRIARIRKHFGERHERSVIRLGICVGTVYKEAEVNIVDRSGFDYPLLIGRSFLEEDFLVDSSRQYTAEPECSDPVD